MKKRGLFIILAAIPAWVYIGVFWHHALRDPFGYGVGSSVEAVPTLVGGALMYAEAATFGGAFVLLCDFVQWIRRRNRDSRSQNH